MHIIPPFLAIIFLLIGLWTFYKARRAASWPKIEAVVVRSEIIPIPYDDSVTSKFEISYYYTINSKAYSGERISFAPTSTYPGYCQNMTDKYPVGSKITVFYNPDNPKDSTLIANTIDSGSILFIVSGLLLSLASLIIHNKAAQNLFMALIE